MSRLIVGKIQTIRNAVSANDSANPTTGSGKTFSGFKLLELEIIIGGTAPSWNITPLLSNAANSAYMEGETITLSGAKTFVKLLEVNDSVDVNFRVDASSGTAPTITIKGRGVNL